MRSRVCVCVLCVRGAIIPVLNIENVTKSSEYYVWDLNIIRYIVIMCRAKE